MKSYGVTIQMKATKQYFPVVLFIMLYKVVLTFESMDEILWCDHSNESYWAVLSCGTVYHALQDGYQPRPQVLSPTRENSGNEIGWL